MKLILILIFTLTSLNAMAKMNFKKAMKSKYENIVSSKLYDCMTCHTIDKWQRNDYGTDLENWLRQEYPDVMSSGRQYTLEMIENGLGGIEELDSDLDGFTNLEEFKALTLPGDPQDHPQSE